MKVNQPEKTHHYFTFDYQIKLIDNEIWHCPFCSEEGNYDHIVDHVIENHKDHIKHFIQMISY